MSRLDDLGEILEGEDKKAKAASAQKLWSHKYEPIYKLEQIDQTHITVISGIKGRFVYQDKENTVKVSYYTIDFILTNVIDEITKVIDEMQVTLYNKTTESIDALVTLKSPETYNRKKLQPYVNQLKMIEEETKNEEGEFKTFRPAFIAGLQAVIKKIMEGDTIDPITEYSENIE